MSLLRAAQGLVPDVASLGIVAELDGVQGYYVEMAERAQRVYCRAVQGPHAVGDQVVLLLEPHEQTPVILGLSPWVVNFEAGPTTLTYSMISDWFAAVESVPDVAANYLARHARGHNLCSSFDHNANGTPQDQDAFTYSSSSSSWGPRALPTSTSTTAGTSGVSRRVRALLLMGC